MTSAEVAIPQSIGSFIKTHCYRCHGAESQEADLSLHDMARIIRDSADALNWQDILDKLNAGEMPPEDEPQPSKAELAMVVGDLTESLQAAQKMLRNTGGAIALRRLNRREYQATIKELMGVRINGEKLPDDPSGRFDTIGQNQSPSAMQLQTYLESSGGVMQEFRQRVKAKHRTAGKSKGLRSLEMNAYRFRPSKPITLGDFSQMAVNGVQVPFSITASHFTDVPRRHPAFKYIETLYDHSTQSKRPFFDFESSEDFRSALAHPDKKASRAQAARILSGLLKKKVRATCESPPAKPEASNMNRSKR